MMINTDLAVNEIIYNKQNPPSMASSPAAAPAVVKHLSESFIKPFHTPEEANHPYYLGPWDLAMFSVNYIQKGLLFPKPKPFHILDYLQKLKHSLSLTLVHFYPLAGRLATSTTDDPPSYVIYVDCKDSPGARFIHASVDLLVSDILSPTYTPLIVHSFFDHHKAVNHDGHEMSLLTIQVTELIDGIFIGCSANHCLVDGTSYWHFFNMFSEIFQKGDTLTKISRTPVLNRWIPDGHGPALSLPYTHPDQFLLRYEPDPLLKERFFHFSSDAIAKLKEKANKEANTGNKISSFQSLSALVWRCITRARRQPPDEKATCRLACNTRSRMIPPLSPDYFGNSILALEAGSTTVGDLLDRNLGWAARQLHEGLVNLDDKKMRECIESWITKRFVYQLGSLFNPEHSIMMGSSPRFKMYENEFGLGKGLALRSGYANKFVGKVTAYPGREGGSSVVLELCLPPLEMAALESDQEFMDAISSPTPDYQF